MTFSKSAFWGLIVLAATAVSSAQHKFPLRSGEWMVTTPDPTGPGKPPFVMPYCLNDETWARAFSNRTCSLQNLSITPSGMSYNLECPASAFQMKGRGTVTFDGMTHMISKGSFDSTANGKTTHMDSTSDYRWKGPTCDPNADMNLKFKQR